MKSATQNLEKDHEYILQLIDVMFVMSQRKVSIIADIEKVISVIRNFADGFHHAKEEHFLFPSMVQKGFSTTQGPIAVMLQDHVQGRKYVQGMDQGIKLFQNGDNNALEIIYQNMTGYGQLLQNHIAKENNVLFRMADQALSEIEKEQLVIDFEKIESNNINGKNILDYINAINELKMLYN